MCFSATASFITSATLGVVGVSTIKKAKTAAELPIASMPFLFAVQQLLEGLLWVSAPNGLTRSLATYGFILFAYIIWPIIWPWAVFLVEPKVLRKKLLLPAAIMGSVVGAYFLFFLLKGLATAIVLDSGILYDFNVPYLDTLQIMYVVVVIIVGLLSSKRYILIFGLALAAALAITVLVFNATLVSVWCFFAAILSLIIFLHFVYENKKASNSSVRVGKS